MSVFSKKAPTKIDEKFLVDSRKIFDVITLLEINQFCNRLGQNSVSVMFWGEKKTEWELLEFFLKQSHSAEKSTYCFVLPKLVMK